MAYILLLLQPHHITKKYTHSSQQKNIYTKTATTITATETDCQLIKKIGFQTIFFVHFTLEKMQSLKSSIKFSYSI